MQGMRYCRRNPGIAACGCETFGSNGWVIITVDEVMGDAGMPWLLRKDLFEDCRRLQLVRIRFVCRRRGAEESQGVKNSRLGVIWIACGQSLHGLLVCQRPRALSGTLNVLIEQSNSGEIRVLAFGLYTHWLGLVEDRGAFLQGLGSRGSSKRVAQEADGDTPISHGTA